MSSLGRHLENLQAKANLLRYTQGLLAGRRLPGEEERERRTAPLSPRVKTEPGTEAKSPPEYLPVPFAFSGQPLSRPPFEKETRVSRGTKRTQPPTTTIPTAPGAKKPRAEGKGQKKNCYAPDDFVLTVPCLGFMRFRKSTEQVPIIFFLASSGARRSAQNIMAALLPDPDSEYVEPPVLRGTLAELFKAAIDASDGRLTEANIPPGQFVYAFPVISADRRVCMRRTHLPIESQISEQGYWDPTELKWDQQNMFYHDVIVYHCFTEPGEEEEEPEPAEGKRRTKKPKKPKKPLRCGQRLQWSYADDFPRTELAGYTPASFLKYVRANTQQNFAAVGARLSPEFARGLDLVDRLIQRLAPYTNTNGLI